MCVCVYYILYIIYLYVYIYVCVYIYIYIIYIYNHNFRGLGFSWHSSRHYFIYLCHAPCSDQYSIYECPPSQTLSMLYVVYLCPDNQLLQLVCNGLFILHFSPHIHTTQGDLSSTSILKGGSVLW